MTGCELHHRHEPLAHEVLQVRLHDPLRGLALFLHSLIRKEKQRSISPRNFPCLYLSIYLSLSLSF
jgi:hypothetical protein